MIGRGTGRKTVALIAAYATALQALLAAFVAVTPATAATAAFHFVICTSDAVQADGRSAPLLPHDANCTAVCAVMTGAPAPGCIDRPAVAALPVATGAYRPALTAGFVFARTASDCAHRSRAPPSA
jgi:hypothetical protein